MRVSIFTKTAADSECVIPISQQFNCDALICTFTHINSVIAKLPHSLHRRMCSRTCVLVSVTACAQGCKNVPHIQFAYSIIQFFTCTHFKPPKHAHPQPTTRASTLQHHIALHHLSSPCRLCLRVRLCCASVVRLCTHYTYEMCTVQPFSNGTFLIETIIHPFHIL